MGLNLKPKDAQTIEQTLYTIQIYIYICRRF